MAFVRERGVMVGKIQGLNGGLEVVTTLDPSNQPFLFDHKIDGTPVLPGVMGIEAFAEAANLLFPELYVSSVDDVQFRDHERPAHLHAPGLGAPHTELEIGGVIHQAAVIGELPLVGEAGADRGLPQGGGNQQTRDRNQRNI